MTDFDINKAEYPLDVIFIPDKEGGYLIEGENKDKKYRPVLLERILGLGRIYFKILFPFTYNFSAGECPGTAFYTKAKMATEDDSISFFGTNREIKNIDIEIFPTDEGMQLIFRGDLSQKYDWDFDEEYIFISMAIAHEQFEKIFSLWNDDNIDEIICSIERKQINGLYYLDSFSPDYEYKILRDRRIVKNYQDMPDHFTDFENSKTYYVSNDCFRLKIKKQKLLQENGESYYDKNVVNEREMNHQETEEKRIILIVDKMDQIKKYINYLIAICFITLIYILFSRS